MATLNSNSRFVVDHSSGTPDDPNLASLADIAGQIGVTSTTVSIATSSAISSITAAVPDSASISQAASRGTSAGVAASVADSKAVSDSGTTSVADSKAVSVSVNTSIADSKATSVGTATLSATALPGEGRTVGTTTEYLANNAWYNVKDYGAQGNDSTDDTTAIQNAFTRAVVSGGTVFFPRGTYKVSSNLTWEISGVDEAPKAVQVIGIPGASIIKHTSAVSIGVTLATDQSSDGTAHRLTIGGIELDGVNTIGSAIGWLVGENTANLSGNITMVDCLGMRFAGVGAKGIYVKNAVGCRYVRCYFGRNATNAYIGGSDLSMPTLQTFESCSFREAGYSGVGTGRGVDLVNGYRITFDEGCLFEANRAENFYCVPPSATNNVVYCQIDNAWFEDAFHGSGAVATNYHIRLDGSSAGTVMMRIANSNGNGSSRSIYAQKVVNFALDNFLPVNAASQIVIDPVVPNVTIGYYSNWPKNNAPWATVATNGSTLFQGLYDSISAQAVAVTGAVTAATVTTTGVVTVGDAVVGRAGATRDLFLQFGLVGGKGALRDSANSEVLHWSASAVTFDQPPTASQYNVLGTKVVGARDTGWSAMTGTTNEATVYDTATVTLAQLAGRVMALQAALTTHGLIGA